jgi:hypothetical protein
VNNGDFALFKNTRLNESAGVQFRTGIFDLFNRVQFALRLQY